MTQEYHDKMGPPRDGKLKGVMYGRHESGTGFRGIELDPAEATLWMHRIENSDYRGRHEHFDGEVKQSWLEEHEGVGPEVVSTRQPGKVTHYCPANYWQPGVGRCLCDGKVHGPFRQKRPPSGE